MYASDVTPHAGIARSSSGTIAMSSSIHPTNGSDGFPISGLRMKSSARMHGGESGKSAMIGACGNTPCDEKSSVPYGTSIAKCTKRYAPRMRFIGMME
jgi:hypothetical protein